MYYFFGFLLENELNPPSYFTLFDYIILLAALYVVTVATAMFIMPVIYHASNYRRLDAERFLSRTKKPVRIGIICITLDMYMGLDWLWIPGYRFRSHTPWPPFRPSLFSLNSSDSGIDHRTSSI
jgi:hypothetical protein